MKPSLLFLLLAFTSIAALGQRDTILPALNLCSQGSWKLVFSDEFNGRSLDRSKWVTWYPYANDGSDNCDFCRTHGNEGQVYMDANVEPSGGTLKLIARREPASWFGAGREYTSGMIHAKEAFGHGRYEMRCKLPRGMGFWTAFWMFGEKATEIDVFEIGTQNKRQHHVGLISWSTKTSHQRGLRSRANLLEGFHTYVMEWDEHFIRFEVDSTEVWNTSRYLTKRGRPIRKCEMKPGIYRLNPSWPPEGEKLKIIVNVAVGTETTPFTKSPDTKTILPNQMEIDWIRVYEKTR